MHVAGDDGEEEQQAVHRRVRSQTCQHHDGQRREEDIDEHHQDAVGEVSHCVEHGWEWCVCGPVFFFSSSALSRILCSSQ